MSLSGVCCEILKNGVPYMKGHCKKAALYSILLAQKESDFMGVEASRTT